MTFLWALVVSLLMLVGVQADDMAERSRLQGFLSKYFIAAASDRTATIRHNRPTHAASQEQSASSSFTSATMEWPNTKDAALQGFFSPPRIADQQQEKAVRKTFATERTMSSEAVDGAALLALLAMLGFCIRSARQPATPLASSDGLGPASDGTITCVDMAPAGSCITASGAQQAFSRRALVDAAAVSAATIALPAFAEVEQLAAPGRSVGAMQKLNSGVRYIDLKEGSGASTSPGSRVSLQWVLRRSNGYFVTSSFGQLASGPDAGILKLAGTSPNDPFLFTVGSGAALPGLDEAVLGMKKGGVRRIVVPTRLSYTQPLKTSPGPLPDDFGARRQIERELAKQDPENFFVLEVEATNVR